MRGAGLAPVVALLFFSASSGFGGEFQMVGPRRAVEPPLGPLAAKVAAPLRPLVAAARGLVPLVEVLPSRLLGRFDDRGTVEVYASVDSTEPEALDALRAQGLAIEVVDAKSSMVQGRIPLEDLESFVSASEVRRLRLPSYAWRRAGLVTSEGDAIHRCNVARGKGRNGAGVEVGVLSDGVSSLLLSRLTGDLPNVDVLRAGSGDEGTALLEIVHDCAPGAALSFYGIDTSLRFIQGVNALAAAGAHVIVDDVAFPAEPYFQDGPVAANDKIVGKTHLRVSSAGNDRRSHYQGAFVAAPPDGGLPGTPHDFAGGDTRLRFFGSGEILLVLQWSNPFGASFDDYDLCVRDTGGSLVGCSDLRQLDSDDPIEGIVLSCSGAGLCEGDLEIRRFDGAAQELELYCYGPCELAEHRVPRDSIAGHPAAKQVLAVGAVGAGTPDKAEFFSSKGPATIVFPERKERTKPDVVGVDCVATSVIGFSPFCGTSAAAPHVAAIAAQVLGGEPALTPNELRKRLRGTAVDLGKPGFDRSYGFGRADAANATP
jgi:subtilisin family serine protease